MTSSEIAKPTPLENSLDKLMLGPKAMQLFIKASIKCPASVTAQGAFIADHCDPKITRPRALGEALLENPDLIDIIVKAGTRAHNRGHVQTSLSAELAKGIIESSFKWAEIMADFTHEDLTKIYEKAYGIARKRPQPYGRPTIDQLVSSFAKRAVKKLRKEVSKSYMAD